ncbi:threonine synthase, partial [Streptococcus pasteurianus]|nr:threonine synthase [Streptococcus pasteurianus]
EKFDDDRIAPVVGLSDHYLLELFHGPTIAFKDMALSLLPHLMKAAQKVLGRDEEIIILTATSGDTGKAAMAGFVDVT